MHRKTLSKITTLLVGAALGLNLMTGVASAAPSSTPEANPSHEKFQCPDEEYLNNVDGHGANNSGGYQSTCDEDDFGGNGQESGPGNQTGKPCAGCVGNADDKNPPGQYPDGSDSNSGYECDGRDRPSKNQQGNGNHGIGDENPAHTGCESSPQLCPDGSDMADKNGDGAVTLADCTPADVDEEPETPMCPGTTTPMSSPEDCDEDPVFCPGTTTPMTDIDGNGVVNAADCNKVDDEDEQPETPTCPQTGAPMTDTDGNGIVNAADCNPKKVDEVLPVTMFSPAPVVLETVAPAVPAVAVLAALDVPAEQVAAPVASPRPTEVLGVQVERTNLARTGLDTDILVLLAGALLFVGALLVHSGRRPVKR